MKLCINRKHLEENQYGEKLCAYGTKSLVTGASGMKAEVMRLEYKACGERGLLFQESTWFKIKNFFTWNKIHNEEDREARIAELCKSISDAQAELFQLTKVDHAAILDECKIIYLNHHVDSQRPQFISAIKHCRSKLGISLNETKDMIAAARKHW